MAKSTGHNYNYYEKSGWQRPAFVWPLKRTEGVSAYVFMYFNFTLTLNRMHNTLTTTTNQIWLESVKSIEAYKPCVFCHLSNCSFAKHASLVCCWYVSLKNVCVVQCRII